VLELINKYKYFNILQGLQPTAGKRTATLYSKVAPVIILTLLGSMAVNLLLLSHYSPGNRKLYIRQKKSRQMSLNISCHREVHAVNISSDGESATVGDHSQDVDYFNRAQNISYHKTVFRSIPMYSQQGMTHTILDEFVVDRKKCSNCLPNYFIRATDSDKPKYRSGTLAFLHHLKAGGTTILDCMGKLFRQTYKWNGISQTGFGNVSVIHFDFNRRMLWNHLWGEKERLKFLFIGGAGVLGICNDIDGMIQPCSYFTLLRDPIDRAVATYFFCQLNPYDELCATFQLSAVRANITDWVLHQRNYLFTQLTFDVRYCDRFSFQASRLTCWYRQRSLMEKTNLGSTLKFVLDDMIDKFAVIGILEYFQESLDMFEEVS
jgi:hypothetical protein